MICSSAFRGKSAAVNATYGRETDIWSLGAMSYEIGVGNYLITGETQLEAAEYIWKLFGPAPRCDIGTRMRTHKCF